MRNNNVDYNATQYIYIHTYIWAGVFYYVQCKPHEKDVLVAKLIRPACLNVLNYSGKSQIPKPSNYGK